MSIEDRRKICTIDLIRENVRFSDLFSWILESETCKNTLPDDIAFRMRETSRIRRESLRSWSNSRYCDDLFVRGLCTEKDLISHAEKIPLVEDLVQDKRRNSRRYIRRELRSFVDLHLLSLCDCEIVDDKFCGISSVVELICERKALKLYARSDVDIIDEYFDHRVLKSRDRNMLVEVLEDHIRYLSRIVLVGTVERVIFELDDHRESSSVA